MKSLLSRRVLITVSCLSVLTGCPEWNSVPTVVDQHLGDAYTNMVKNQTLCIEHGTKAKDPKLCPEHTDVIGMDGQKAKGVLDAYRQEAIAPAEDAKKGVALNVKNVGGSSAGN